MWKANNFFFLNLLMLMTAFKSLSNLKTFGVSLPENTQSNTPGSAGQTLTNRQTKGL